METIPLGFTCDSLHISNVDYVDQPSKAQVDTNCELLEYNLYVEPSSIWSPLWDNGDINNETIYSSSTEEVFLIMESEPNCTIEQLVTLPAFPKLEEIPIIQDTTIFRNIPFDINTRLDSEVWQIQWSPVSVVQCEDCTYTTIIAKESTTVTIYLEHISGCTYESSFFLTIKKSLSTYSYLIFLRLIVLP